MAGEGAVYLPLIGRILVGAFFVFLSISHAIHWRVRSDDLRARNILMPTLFLWVAIILYFICGFFFIFHFAMPSVVFILAIMLIIRALILGNFWSKKAVDQHTARIQFMTNIALLGAVLMAL